MHKTALNITLACCLLLAAPLLLQAQNYTISTVAGTGAAGFAGDGGAASAAQLNVPWGVLVDSSGNLYIADQLNDRIRKISTDGSITTAVGSGTSGFAGDGAGAGSAQISFPTGLAISGSGNLYFSDTGNHRVRMVSAGGTISTVAGNGTASYEQDGVAATSTTLNTPLGLALDSAGNLYIADSYNHRIREVVTGGNISTVAGSGTEGFGGDDGAAIYAALNYPQGIAFDAAGNLYIADTFNHRIRKVATDGTITTVAGNGVAGYSGDGGPAVQAELNYPKSVVPDAAGNLYIADAFNSRIRRVSPDGTIATIAGNGRFGDVADAGDATKAVLRFPFSVAVDPSGKLYFSDAQNSRVRMLTSVSAGDKPVISEGGVITAAASSSCGIAPGAWVEIYGSHLAAGGSATIVTIDGQDASVSYASPNQVDAQLPLNLGSGPRQVRVVTPAGISAPHTVNVSATPCAQ